MLYRVKGYCDRPLVGQKKVSFTINQRAGTSSVVFVCVCVCVCVHVRSERSSLVAQQVKDLALSLLQLGALLWYGFDPWPGNVYMPQVQPINK